MVLLFSIVVAFVVAQCVFCILYGSSYAVPAVTVASAVGTSKGAALEFQSRVTTGLEVVGFCTYKEEVSVVNQIFEPHRLFAQCPANDAPAQTQSPHTTHPPLSSLPTSSPKKSPNLMDFSPRSESPMRRTTHPLDNRSIAEPLFSADPNPPYNPPYDDSNNGTTRSLLIGFVLCSFGALFGSALVIKRVLKSGGPRAYFAVLSRLFGGLNLVLLYALLAGDGVRVHRQNGPLAQRFIFQPSSSSQTPVGSEESGRPSDHTSQPDGESQASLTQHADAGAKNTMDVVTITRKLSNGASVPPVNPAPTTTPEDLEAKKATEFPSPPSVAAQDLIDARDTDARPTTHDSTNPPASLSNVPGSVNEVRHDEAKPAISCDLLPALGSGSTPLSLPWLDPSTRPSLSISEAESSSQAQSETVVHSVSLAQVSAYIGNDSHSQGSTNISADNEAIVDDDTEVIIAESEAGETSPTTNEPSPKPTQDNDQVQHTDSVESGTSTAEVVATNAEPSHPHVVTQDQAPATAYTPAEDINLPEAAPLMAVSNGTLGNVQSIVQAGSPPFLIQSSVAEDNEMADGYGDLGADSEANDEMAVQVLPPATRPENLPSDDGAFDTLAQTTEVVTTAEPRQDPQPSTSTITDPVASSSTDASVELPRLRKRKTLADSAHREADVQIKYAHPTKRQRTISDEEVEFVAGSSQPSQAVPPVQPAAPNKLVTLSQPTSPTQTSASAQSSTPVQLSASVASVEVTSVEQVEKRVDRKRKAEEPCGPPRTSKSKKASHEGHEAALKWRWPKENNVRDETDEKGAEAEKRETEAKDKKGRKEKKSQEEREEKRIKRSLKGKEKEALPDPSIGKARDPPAGDETLASHGEPSHTESGSSRQLDTIVDELAQQLSSAGLLYRSAAPLENTGSTDASTQADHDHPAEPTLGTKAGASSAITGACKKPGEPSTPPRNSRPPVKVQKLKLIVREPKPESKDGEVTPPGSPTQEMLRQKGARQLEARKRMEVEASGRGGTGRLVRTHRQPYQAARENKKKRVEKKKAAEPSYFAGEDVVQDKEAVVTEDVAEPEGAAGTEAAAGTGAVAESENLVEGSSAVETGVALTAQEIADEAARWLESVMGDLDQSFMPAGPSTTDHTPPNSSFANSSDGAGNSESSQLFLAGTSMETQPTDLEDYEDAIAVPSAQPAGAQNQSDAQVKQEEEEYVFPPWNEKEAEEQYSGLSEASDVAGPSNLGAGAGPEPEVEQEEEGYVFPPGNVGTPPPALDDSYPTWSAPIGEVSQPWPDVSQPTFGTPSPTWNAPVVEVPQPSAPALATYFWHGHLMAVPAPGAALEIHMVNGGFPLTVVPKRQREDDDEEDVGAPAFKKSRTSLSQGVRESMVARISNEDRERLRARKAWGGYLFDV
ncbi:hypothetical protein BDV93DRAFT_548769 [Ceratobasidium sp. AG-I]|nr:hypothetical protein BDV93DRAFT_548769 [Ceratobasidium sp. AG-I]